MGLATSQKDRKESCPGTTPGLPRILILRTGLIKSDASDGLEKTSHIVSGDACAVALFACRQLRSQGRKTSARFLAARRSRFERRFRCHFAWRKNGRAQRSIAVGERCRHCAAERAIGGNEIEMRIPLMLTEAGERANVQNEILDVRHDAAPPFRLWVAWNRSRSKSKSKSKSRSKSRSRRKSRSQSRSRSQSTGTLVSRVPGVRTPGFMMAPHSRLGRGRVGPRPRAGKRALFTEHRCWRNVETNQVCPMFGGRCPQLFAFRISFRNKRIGSDGSVFGDPGPSLDTSPLVQ
jgi:hypothetical protein